MDHPQHNGDSPATRTELLRQQQQSAVAEQQRIAGQTDLDALDELYAEFEDGDDYSDDGADDNENDDGNANAEEEGGARTGERMDDHKRRLAKEKREKLTQTQRAAAAEARKEAKEKRAAELAKEKALAKEAKATAKVESQKDTSQRTLLETMHSVGGVFSNPSSKGKLDIDKHLSAGNVGGEGGASSSEVLSAAARHEQVKIAALGKSILAGLGDDSDEDDDDDDAIDINAALFGDVTQKSRAIDNAFGKAFGGTDADHDNANAAPAPSTTAPTAMVDRLDDEQQFDYNAVANAKKNGAAANKKAPMTAAAAAALASSSSAAMSGDAAKSAAAVSNFKQREKGVVATTEHIAIDGGDVNGDGNNAALLDEEAREDHVLTTAAGTATDKSQQSSYMGGATAANQEAASSKPCMAQTHGTFYWLDAKEVGPHSMVDAGSVYLIGKLQIPNGKAYESCCIRVNNMYRSLFFRPMPGSSEQDVAAEIQQALHRQGIKVFAMRPRNRYYVFDEPDVPREKRELQVWWKVNYSASFPLFSVPQAFGRPPSPDPSVCPAPIPLPGYKHIELCIGADRSLVETFLLKRRLKSGPCFLRFNERLTPVPVTARVSHCKHEFILTKPKAVFPFDLAYRNSDFGAAPASLGNFYNGTVPSANAASNATTATYSSLASFVTTQQLLFPPTAAPSLSGATIQLVTQMNSAGSQNEIFAICIALCPNGILPDGGKRAVPATEHMLLIRPFDSRTPLPLDLSAVGRGSQLRVQTCSSEKDMLQYLVDFLLTQDPDVLFGHNFVSFTLDVLLHRMQQLYIHNWSALGRIRQSHMPQLQKGAGGMRESTYAEKEACLGRLLCDTYLLAREHHKSSNYKLVALAREMGLKGIYTTGVTQEMVEEAPPTITKDLLTSTKDTVHMLGRCLNLSRLTFELAYRLDMIPLTKQLCAQSGTCWSRVLIGSRSERIEFLLLHAFYAQKYVLPEKKRFGFNNANNNSNGGAVKRLRDADDGGMPADMDGGEEGAAAAGTSTSSKRSAKYKGGMVLEPISGLYQDYILLLDFNSLYPSLIQEFNICFTTVNRSSNPNAEVAVPLAEDLTCKECVKGAKACPHKMILPKVIERLVTSRREVKRRMKTERNEDVLAQLDIRQMALKLTANSMYGCLGFEYSRFYAQPLAEIVTSKGRDTLANTVSLIPTVAPSLRVIYGDTDSVMMQTGVKDSLATVREFGQRIQAAVNKKYRKLEIGIDGVFRSILLMTKKKYAALSVNNWEGAGDDLSEVVKGLDMVRRDWCPLVRVACRDILHRILRGVASPTSANAQHVVALLAQQQQGAGAAESDEDDVLQFILSYMQKVAEDVRSGTAYELKEFVISKSLTKEPESYKGDNFPHATVALRMKQRKEAVRVGDLIPYVICKERARLPNAQKVKAEGVKVEGGGAVKAEAGEAADSAATATVKAEKPDDDNAANNDANANEGDVGGAVEEDMAMQGSKLSHHAYHEDEVKRDPAKHHLDVEWYLSTQIYPPVLRICQHIQGFSASQLAEYMQLKNAQQIAANAEAAEGGISGVVGSSGSAGNTWGTFDTQYLSRFKTNRLEECFPLAEPVQIKCTKCSRISSLQPHDHVERNILPLYLEKKKDAGFATNPTSVFRPFHLYSCSNCHSFFPLRYVSNTMSLFIQQRLRQFYKAGGGAVEVAKIQSQVSYLRALFDVPHLPGTSPDVIALHKQFALRCIDEDGGLCTLEAASQKDGTDPVKELVDRTYRRIKGLRVDTEELFKRVDIL